MESWCTLTLGSVCKWSRCSRSSFEGSQTTYIQSPRYGTNPKSVNTKVVAINELKHIVIGSFCIKWIFLSFLDTRILNFGTSDSAMLNQKTRFWPILTNFTAKSWTVTPHKIKKKYQLRLKFFQKNRYFCHFSMILDAIFGLATRFSNFPRL